eukprot:TRINITY_DN6263_c0_g2_i1.p1 TRINITY_DN6263_c0_g2~~TRINITY_DN6263_c0_g2_i1.p1  ORF type:complete len:599 (+),score=124.12 TRINITY_DN6263_c0_g2_i1:39-1835(+)
MATAEDAGGLADAPIAETWSIFSSPCDGVVWDSFHHGWVAQPASNGASELERATPELFAPAELGMEGAKLAAVRRRREMESQQPQHSQVPQLPLGLGNGSDRQEELKDEHWSQVRAVNGFTLDAAEPEEHLPSAASAAWGFDDVTDASDLWHAQAAVKSSGSLSVPLAEIPRSSTGKAAPPLGRLGSCGAKAPSQKVRPRSVSPPLLPSQRLRRDGSDAVPHARAQALPNGRRTPPSVRQPRQVMTASRSPSPGKASGVQHGGATSSSGGRSGGSRGSRANAASHQASHAPQRGKAQKVHRSDAKRGTPAQADRVQHSNEEVMQHVHELWRKLEEVREEAQRERSEKEELRQQNEDLQLRLEAMSKEFSAQLAAASGTFSNAQIKAPSPPKSLTSSFRQVFGEPREPSPLDTDTAPMPLPVQGGQQPQLRQSLPSQTQRQLLHESSGSQLVLPVQHRLLGSTASVAALPTASCSSGRSSSLGAPSLKTPCASPSQTNGRATLGSTAAAMSGMGYLPGGQAGSQRSTPSGLQVMRDVRLAVPAGSCTVASLRSVALMPSAGAPGSSEARLRAVVPGTTLRAVSPPGTRYAFLPTTTSPR